MSLTEDKKQSNKESLHTSPTSVADFAGRIFGALGGKVVGESRFLEAHADVLPDNSFEYAVTQARKTGSSAILTNRSLTHAKHVVAELLKLAIEQKKNVFLVSGRLNGICYDAEVVELAREALASGIAISAIVTDLNAQALSQSAFANVILSADLGRLYLPNVGVDTSSFVHFTVVSDLAYRFETDKGQATAILSFNQKLFADRLTLEFNKLVANCSLVLSRGQPSK